MKIGIIQPPYPTVRNRMSPKTVYQYIIQQLYTLPTDLDWVILPEYSNCPGIIHKEDILSFIKEESHDFIDIVSSIGLKKGVNIAVNGITLDQGRIRNTTIVVDRKGKYIEAYNKVHLTQYEKDILDVTPGDDIKVMILEGVRISFMTCFDLYFSEFNERIAAERPDLIICPSYQRSEQSDIIGVLTRSRAVDANTCIIRVSYSMGDDEDVGGNSMVVSSAGEVLLNARNKIGLFVCSMNINQKRIRPTSHQQDIMDARDILDYGRRPEVYRPAGAGVIPPDHRLAYPRISAHRGLSALCPENTLAAFGAAIACEADEIELDICRSLDGELVVSHDDAVERISNGRGFISQMTWEQIKILDIGNVKGLQTENRLKWKNIRFCRLDDVLERFAGRVIINIEIKNGNQDENIYSVVEKTIELLYRYNCQNHAYIAGHKKAMEAARQIDNAIARCCMEGQSEMGVVENAIKYKCGKTQFFKPACTKDLAKKIKKAHSYGIRCNMAWSDDPEETIRFLEMGIDCILSNNILDISSAVRSFERR